MYRGYNMFKRIILLFLGLNCFIQSAQPTLLMQGAKYAAAALNFGIANWYIAKKTYKTARLQYLIDQNPVMQQWPEISSDVKEDFCKPIVNTTQLKDKDQIQYRMNDAVHVIAELRTPHTQTIIFDSSTDQTIKHLLTAKTLSVADGEKTKELELTPYLRYWYLQPYVWAFYHETKHLENNDNVKRMLALPISATLTQGACSTLYAGIKKTSLAKFAPKNPFSMIAINAGIGLTKLSTTWLTHNAYVRKQETAADKGATQYFKNTESIDSIVQYLDTLIDEENKSLAKWMHISEKDVALSKEEKPWLFTAINFLVDPEHPTLQTRKDQLLQYRQELINAEQKTKN